MTFYQKALTESCLGITWNPEMLSMKKMTKRLRPLFDMTQTLRIHIFSNQTTKLNKHSWLDESDHRKLMINGQSFHQKVNLRKIDTKPDTNTAFYTFLQKV